MEPSQLGGMNQTEGGQEQVQERAHSHLQLSVGRTPQLPGSGVLRGMQYHWWSFDTSLLGRLHSPVGTVQAHSKDQYLHHKAQARDTPASLAQGVRVAPVVEGAVIEGQQSVAKD